MKFYGYGIVDKAGEPYWSEACVCEDRGPMDDTAEELNVDHPEKEYRVVKLYFETSADEVKREQAGVIGTGGTGGRHGGQGYP